VSGSKTTAGDIRRQRRRSGHGCWEHLVVAPLWVAYGANLNVAVAGSLVLYRLAGLS